MNIPSCIDPAYWSYHKLTQNDINTIITHIPSWLLWMTAIMYGKIVTWAMVKYSFSDIFGTMINNKTLAMQYLLQYSTCSHHVNMTNMDRLDMASNTIYNHTPPIPKYIIDIETFDYLTTQIVPNLQPLRFQQEPTTIPYCMEFKNKLWVPTTMEDCTHICMVHAYRKENHTVLFETGFSHLSRVGKYKGEILYLSDEVIWFCK